MTGQLMRYSKCLLHGNEKNRKYVDRTLTVQYWQIHKNNLKL